MNHRIALLAGALLGLIGVAVGAFGAHALHPYLVEHGMLEVWQTAVQYQLIHAVALVGLAGWLKPGAPGKALGRAHAAAWCWIGGTVLFSGSLYLLATGGPRWIGAVTPCGGLAYLAGWLLVFLAALVRLP